MLEVIAFAENSWNKSRKKEHGISEKNRLG